MPNVVILQGLPASGKSTRAAQLVTAGYRRVNKDDLRAMIDAGVYRSDLEPLIKAARDSIIFAAVVAGFNVVVDDLNIGGGHIERITRLVGYHASVQVEVIDTPIEVCIRRDAARPAPVGELVIRLTEKGLPMSLMEMAVDTSCTQGSGMSITGNFSLSDADECEALVDIATDYPQFRPDDLTVVVTRSNGHYVHSNMMRVEVEWEGDAIVHDLTETTIDELHELGLHEAWVEQPLSDMAERIRAVLIDLCDDAHRKAEDCALSDSDGYINEWMDDMGYWFDEDGQIIKRSED